MSTLFGLTIAYLTIRSSIPHAQDKGSTHYLGDGCIRQCLWERLRARVARHVVRDRLLGHDLADLLEVVAELGGPLREEVLWRDRLIIYVSLVSDSVQLDGVRRRHTDDPVELAGILDGDAVRLLGEPAQDTGVAQLLERWVCSRYSLFEVSDNELDNGQRHSDPIVLWERCVSAEPWRGCESFHPWFLNVPVCLKFVLDVCHLHRRPTATFACKFRAYSSTKRLT